MTEALYFPSHVFFCVAQGHGIFLDLKQDKYSAISFHDADAGASLAEKISAQRDALLQAGLLTTDSDNARPVAASAIEEIDAHIFGLDDQRAFGLTGEAAEGLNISLGEMFDFFWASWKASRDLKTKHISETVAEVHRRKRPAASLREDHNLQRLTAVFRRLRPWYPRKYLCLYDSLALVEFMARRGAYPLWVFAVQAQPFGAHCWVQNERLLLNESTEYAKRFTPIMSV